MSESLQRGLIVVLAAITAVVHLWLGIGGLLNGDFSLVMFVLNGLGFIGLLAAMFVPGIPIFSTRRKLAGYLMIGFVALTFILFFVVNGFSYWNAAAVIAKLAELLLIVVTFAHLRYL
jgi:hypothetical protein